MLPGDAFSLSAYGGRLMPLGSSHKETGLLLRRALLH